MCRAASVSLSESISVGSWSLRKEEVEEVEEEEYEEHFDEREDMVEVVKSSAWFLARGRAGEFHPIQHQ